MAKTPEERARDSATDVLDRAERELRQLSEMGVDTTALTDRFNLAKTKFGSDDFAGAESICSEILVLARSMGAITSASMANQSRSTGGEKISESLKMEVTRLVASEVSSRVETVARTLPTTSSIESTVQTKIQEAMVTGGLMERLEAVATDKANTAVSAIPRFTAKDAQAAANLVVQRALTQFLSSKELANRIGKAVTSELDIALTQAEEKIVKDLDSLLNSRIASAVGELPSEESVATSIEDAQQKFVKSELFEEHVLTLAAERAKAEMSHVPDVMTEAAAKLARQEADALLKTHVRSKEFADSLRQISRDSANEILENSPSLAQEDVEVIAMRVAEESLGRMVESDIMRERVTEVAKDISASALADAGLEDKIKEAMESARDGLASNEALDKQIKDAVQQSRLDLMTNEDFSNWIKDGAKEAMAEIGLGGGMEELEKRLMSKDKVETISRYEAENAAISLLEKKEFSQRFVEMLDDKLVRSKLGELGGDNEDALTNDEVEQTATMQARNVFAEQLDSDEFADRVAELLKASGGGGDTEKLAEELKKQRDRTKKMEKALPALVKKIAGESAPKLDPSGLKEQVTEVVTESIDDISNSAAFKGMLDAKFKVMMKYMTDEVIPKQIKRIMGSG